MIRILLAGLAIGFVIQIVTTVSWMVLPFHGDSLQDFPHDRQAAVAFLNSFPGPGVYHFPGLSQGMEEAIKLSKEGPVVTKMVVHPAGLDPMAPKTFALSIMTHLIAGIVGAFLFSLCRPRGLFRQAGFGLALGTFSCLTAVSPEALWWSYPSEFSLLTATDLLVAWGLAGVVAGRLIAPRTQG